MVIHDLSLHLFPSHAEFQLLVAVHAEHADGGAANLGLADDVNAIPSEMLVPVLLARVKERGQSIGLGINSSEIGAFVEITVDAGETEVRFIVSAAVLDRADVLDVQGGEGRVFLMGLAILAAVSRSLSGKGSRGGGHAALPDLNFLASRRKTATNLLALTYPAYSSRSSEERASSVFFAASSSIRSRSD
jgi:hypothetical protein